MPGQIIYIEDEDRFITINSGTEGVSGPRPPSLPTSPSTPSYIVPTTFAGSNWTGISYFQGFTQHQGLAGPPPPSTPLNWWGGEVGKYRPEMEIPTFGESPYHEQLMSDPYGVNQFGYPLTTSSIAALDPMLTRQPNMLFPTWVDVLMPDSNAPPSGGTLGVMPNIVAQQAQFRFDLLSQMYPDLSFFEIAALIDASYRADVQEYQPWVPPGVTEIGPLQYSGGGGALDAPAPSPPQYPQPPVSPYDIPAYTVPPRTHGQRQFDYILDLFREGRQSLFPY